MEDTPPFGSEESVDLPAAAVSAGAPPLFVPIAALFAAASGLAAVVIGATRVGGLLPVLGAVWMIAGGALFADRRATWLFALGAYAVNAIHLIYLGFRPLPEWLSGGFIVVWGIAALAMGAALLHPNLQKRFGPNRRKF